MKLDKADIIFSTYIRTRDKQCIRCGSKVQFNYKGNPISHTASHYFGRGRENTRFDPLNVDTLCFGCHRFWGSDNREEYRQFKINQLGQVGYDSLCVRAETYCKKDRTLSYLAIKQLLKELVKLTVEL